MPSIRTRVATSAGPILAALLIAPQLAHAAAQLRVVAATGQPSGVGFEFGAAFDAAERIVLRGVGPLGIWMEEPTGLVLKLRSGQQAPEFPSGALINSLHRGGPVGPRGFSAAVGSVHGGPIADIPAVAYLDKPGVGFRLASYTGKVIDPAADIRVAAFEGNLEPMANDSGELLMRGLLTGGPFGGTRVFGTWVERPSGSQVVFHADTLMPGMPGVKFGDYVVSKEYFLDEAGRVGVVNAFSNGQGVWVFDPATPANNRLVARTGVAGVPITDIRNLNMSAGRVVFQAGYSAIYAETDGTLEVLAHEGAAAPGFGPNARFRDFPLERTATDRFGNVALVGGVADPSLPTGFGEGIWIDAPDRPLALALNFENVPGLASANSVSDLVMNDGGQMAFTTFHSVNPRREVWSFDPASGPQRVVAWGDELTLSIGGQQVVKTVSDFQVGGYVESRLGPARYLNEVGDVVFVARFTDQSSAVIVWSPVPEAASAGGMIAALIGCHTATRRRGKYSKPSSA